MAEYPVNIPAWAAAFHHPAYAQKREINNAQNNDKQVERRGTSNGVTLIWRT